MTFNFADFYRQATLSPTAEMITARQTTFEKLRKEKDISKYLTLVEIYFGKLDDTNHEWFRAAFAADDNNTFSFVNNARECAVLAGSLLKAAMLDGKDYVGLALLTAYANGGRQPQNIPELIEDALGYIALNAEASKKFRSLDLLKLQQTVKAKPTADQDVPSDWAGTFATQTLASLTTLANHQRLLVEETEMLWWYIGGWSKKLRVPFETLDVVKRNCAAGLDLAGISATTLGPVSAPAILSKMVADFDSGNGMAIDKIVDELSEEDLSLFPLFDTPNPWCFPMLTAFQKAREIGASPSWHQNYEKTCAIPVATEFKALDLSLQIFREVLLAKVIGASQ